MKIGQKMGNRKIVETFYLPYKKGETLNKIKKMFFRQYNPYKYSKREGSK